MPLTFPDQQLCGQWENFTTPDFTFFQNAWGQDGSGGSCLNVTSNATSFASTWKWTNETNENLVHAYPNVNLNTIQQSPVNISSISSLDVNVNWNMHPSVLTTSSSFEVAALQGVDTISNVAFDMFLDQNSSKSNSTSSASYEVMFWLGTIGTIYPIGASNTTLARPTCNVGNTMFSMYNGTNSNGQHVFTWLANGNTTKFSGDLQPCIRYLVDHSLIPASNFLGVIQFGTETLHAKEYVTFTASNIAINVTKYGATKSSNGVQQSRSKGSIILAGMLAVAVLLY